jgi:hypothetical protein
LSATSSTNRVEFVPVAGAYQVAKHPTLPALYVGLYDAPESKNLITFRLGPDGSILTNSQRVCDDYFSADGKTPSFRHCLRSIAVNAEKGLLCLAAYPVTANSVTTYGDTNNFDFVVVALDAEGQPAKRLRLFRSDISGQQGFMNLRYLPSLRRLFLNYYTTVSWLDLGNDGVPVSGKTASLLAPHTMWNWVYVPEWDRFYGNRVGSELAIFEVKPGSTETRFHQLLPTTRGGGCPTEIQVSSRHRKVYVLDTVPGRELIVYSLDARGRLIGVPRHFAIGPTGLLRCDFKSGQLFAVSKESVRMFSLDAEGVPKGAPQVHPLNHGDINDAFLDEATGKLYIACTKLPSAQP